MEENSSSHPQHPRLRTHHPRPKRPAERVSRPPARPHEVPIDTHIRDRGIGHLAVPLVLNFGDLVTLRVDQNLGVDRRLLAETLDFVQGLHVQFNRIAVREDFVVLALDGGEGCLEAVLLVVSACALHEATRALR
jgi:hypothetical protein